MTLDDQGEADRLREMGRMKILRTCLIWGIPLLAILVVAGLQYAGAIHLEEEFAVPPDKLDQRTVWLIIAVGALLQFFIVTIGVLQGWNCIRRANQLRSQGNSGTQ